MSFTYADVDGSGDPAGAAAWMDRLQTWPAVRAYKSHLRSRVRAQPGRYLDVGCGPGDDVLALGPGAVGLDPSRTMVEQACGRGALVVRGVAGALPFPDGAFSGISADRVLQHLADPDGALAEMVRVTAAGGTVAVADPHQGTLAIDGPDPALAAAVVRFRAEVGIRNGFIAGEMPDRMAAVGLSGVETASFPLALTDVDDAFGLATWARTLQERGVFTAAQATRFDRTLAEAGTAGTFRYRVDFVVTSGRRAR